jgi:type II secretory pathway pseudopilin PulG
MVAIVIFLLLLSISMMAVAPAVTKVMQREREEELIFRGKQYAQAFLNFQKRQGRFPLELKELMQTQPRSARKLFKEPMCDCDDWGLIHVGQPWPPPKINPADSATGATDTSSGSPNAGNRQRPGQPASPLPSSYTQPPPSGPGATGHPNRGNGAGFSNDATFQNSGKEVTNTPIIGVYSKAHKKGLRTFKGEEYYDLWGFIAGQSDDDLPDAIPLPRNQPKPNPDPGVLGPPNTSHTPPPSP